MKTKSKILCFYGLIFLAWIIFGSNASNPPDGKTNAPFNGFCTECHSGGSFNGTVGISGIPSTVMAGETYPVTLTVTVTQGSPVRAGFQMVSVFTPGNTNAGDFMTNSADEGTSSAGGREYIDHRGAKNFSGGEASWTFNWKAPDGPHGATITMYYAGNITNGNISSSGDRPVSGNTSFTLDAGSTPVVATISSHTNVSCNGGNDGSATASGSGGTPPYTYAWSNGANTATASNLTAGNYTVTISDNSSMSTASVNITQPAVLNTAVSGNNVLCNGGNTGSATANPSGGTAPYQYLWSNSLTSKTISNLSAGSYQVTVTDSHGCTETGSVMISQPSALNIVVNATDETAPMASDGTATVNASGGTSPYSYAWSNGANTSNLSNLAPGSYQVTVTDANQCQQVGMATVQGISCSLVATVSETPVTCFGESTGSAMISVTGAQNPVSYAWSHGQMGASATGLMAGMYDATVEDDNGCQTIVPVTITQPQEISIHLAANPLSCPDADDGDIFAMVSGGLTPYNYAWSNGGMSSSLTGIPAGNYQLTVTDANGCMQEASIALTVQDTTLPVLVTQGGAVYLDSLGLVVIPVDLPFVGGVDNCEVDSLWAVEASVSCGQLGQVEITYMARDVAGNISEETATITVIDTIAPYFLTCVEDIEVDTGTMVMYDLPEAFDNCGIDTFLLAEGLPSGSVFPPGETKVSYMAVDQSGNIGCCSFFVYVGGTVSTIDETFSQDINVFPNPVKTNLKIGVESEDPGPMALSIFNAAGQQVFEIDSQYLFGGLLDLDLAGLSKGIYFIRIVQQQKTAIRKIFKE